MASTSTLVPLPTGSIREPDQTVGDTDRRPGSYRLHPIVRSLALALALVGTIEVVLHRTAAPIVSHLPGIPGGATTADVVRLAGDAALGATSLLVPLLALALGLHLWRRHRLVSILLLGAFGVALGVVVPAGSAWSAPVYALVAVTSISVVVMAARSVPRLHAVAVGVAALGFLAGLYPIAAEAFASTGLLPTTGVGGVSWRTLAEIGLVVSAVLFGTTALRTAPSRAAWWSAAMTAGVVAVVIAFRPDYVAMSSLWAFGVTLTLPPALYIAGAAGFAAAVVAWLAVPATRHRAAGIVLLAVVGIAPALVHHDVTLVLALVLLAMPVLGADDSTERAPIPSISDAHPPPAASGT